MRKRNQATLSPNDLAALTEIRVKNKQQKKLKISKLSPSEWIQDTFGKFDEDGNPIPYLLPYQAEIADKLEHNDIAIASANATGKTFIAAHLVLWYINKYIPSIVITTAPTERQVEKLLWAELKSAFRSSNYRLPGKLYNLSLRISPKHYAIGFTAPPKSGQKASGFHQQNTLIVVDEASDISDDIYDAIRGVMAGGDVRIMCIGNPDVPIGRFYDLFQKPNDFFIKNISVFDSANLHGQRITLSHIRSGKWKEIDDKSKHKPGLVTPKWVAGVWEDYGEDHPFFHSRVLGIFPKDIEGGLVSLADVQLSQRIDNDDIVLGDEVVISIDVARSERGDDSVIAWRNDRYFEYFWEGKTIDTMIVTGNAVRCIEFIKDKFSLNPVSIRVNIDAIGVGAGVADRLKEQEEELEVDVFPVNVGWASTEPKKFFNLRSELFWEVREQILKNNLKLPNCKHLPFQLSNIKWEITSAGKTKVESKEKTKLRIGRSPDHADALILSFYEKKKKKLPLFTMIKDFKSSSYWRS